MNKEYIFDAAVSLFRHQGIRATRMDDVAEFLHMSKRTLYEQFPSKEEFIVACIEYEMKKELETVERPKISAARTNVLTNPCLNLWS